MLKRWNFLKTGFYEGIKIVRKAVEQVGAALDSPNAPVVIVAHSLGAHVISNYIWDAQERKGLWHGKEPSKFEELGTTAYMFTAGCNIPLFVSGLSSVEAIRRPNDGFKWLNFYDKDDVLGWPLKPLPDGKQHSYSAVVTTDRPINSGNILVSWTPGSHTEYLKSSSFLKPLAAAIKKLHSELPDAGA